MTNIDMTHKKNEYIDINYKDKYIKYKNKYIKLKSIVGGAKTDTYCTQILNSISMSDEHKQMPTDKQKINTTVFSKKGGAGGIFIFTTSDHRLINQKNSIYDINEIIDKSDKVIRILFGFEQIITSSEGTPDGYRGFDTFGGASEKGDTVLKCFVRETIEEIFNINTHEIVHIINKICSKINPSDASDKIFNKYYILDNKGNSYTYICDVNILCIFIEVLAENGYSDKCYGMKKKIDLIDYILDDNSLDMSSFSRNSENIDTFYEGNDKSLDLFRFIEDRIVVKSMHDGPHGLSEFRYLVHCTLQELFDAIEGNDKIIYDSLKNVVQKYFKDDRNYNIYYRFISLIYDNRIFRKILEYSRENIKKIGFDFDGVIHGDVLETDAKGTRHPLSHRNISTNKVSVIEDAIKEYSDKKYDLYIITARTVRSLPVIHETLRVMGYDKYFSKYNIFCIGETGFTKIDVLNLLNFESYYDDSITYQKQIKESTDLGILKKLKEFNLVVPESNKIIKYTVVEHSP